MKERYDLSEYHKLNVMYGDREVGTLAEGDDHFVSFSYADSWIEEGFSISPFSLPLKKQVFTPTKTYFDGLFGVFADSLPDSWGRLVVDRLLEKEGIDPRDITPMQRLSVVSSSGMGALTYHPQIEIEKTPGQIDFDRIASECRDLIDSKPVDDVENLFHMGGSSGGTRPKIMIDIDDEPWIVKFPAHTDIDDIGIMEYDYSVCAKKCGIKMEETRLFPSDKCKGFFGTRRFDRGLGSDRTHVVTAAGLLELDYNQPSLDYRELMKLVKIMTGDNEEDVLQMYRIMCFNVFAHNQDDHAKNFSFLYDDKKTTWHLSPAYDLTYSSTYYNEHTTSVAGEGRAPGRDQILEVAAAAGIKKKKSMDIIDEISEIVSKDLSLYL